MKAIEMGKNKSQPVAKKQEVSLVRSSAAEYLTFIASSGQGGIEAVYADENVWLTQKMMGVLYAVETQTINYHLKKVFADSELEEDSVIRNFRITAADGKSYSTKHYKLAATIIYATSLDYDVSAQATKRFFATVQNKLHWAIHGQTAAEVIYQRADAVKDNMGLTTWKDAPQGKIQKFDVVVAKNYLTEHEVAQLQRLVSAYLDVAESMALRQIPMTMQDWESRLNRFIEVTDRDVLQDAGKITAEIAKAHAESEFEKYRVVQDRLFESDFDRMIRQVEIADEPISGDNGM